jgi:hypothetical protein
MKNVLNKIGRFAMEVIKFVCDVVMLILLAIVAVTLCALIPIAGLVTAIYDRRSPSDTIHDMFTVLYDLFTNNN